MGNTALWRECAAIQDELVEIRRALHRIPETGERLEKTSAYVMGKLDQWGISYVRSVRDSAIAAHISGSRPGRRIILRADMDALPIKEETGASYASEHDGFMHACGHDAHTAMLLGAAKVLQSNRAALKGEAVLIFQTAEETAKGAKNVIANGWLDGADAAFGIHIGTIISNTAPAGTIFAVPGCCMASIDRFTIRVTGAGCHGSTPEKGTDPINAAAHIITALQAINSREFNACAPIVVTIGSIHGGSQYNIIPDCVEMEGTIRSVDNGVRMAVAQRIEQIAAAQAAVFGADAQCIIDWGAPPVINDESMARLAAEAAKEITGEERTVTRLAAPNMGGEDFAYYLEKLPGAYLFLSSANGAKNCAFAHHNSRFNVDEDVLHMGAALYVNITERFLNN